MDNQWSTAPDRLKYGNPAERDNFKYIGGRWTEYVLLINRDGFTKIVGADPDTPIILVPKAIKLSEILAIENLMDLVQENLVFEITREVSIDAKRIYREKW